MPRLLLHFALVLSLIFNGISAPWAMARMGHGDHGAHDARAIHHDAAQSAPHDSTAHHRHHDHLDVPPVLALRMTGVLPVSIGMPAFVAAESHPVLRRTSPPLRPPAA
jgi:hypothetical protein